MGIKSIIRKDNFREPHPSCNENDFIIQADKAAQQSVHLTGGILRHFQALSTLEQNPALEVLSTPAHPQVTQTVRWLLSH